MKNPYTRGNYMLGFAFMMAAKVITRSALVKFLMTLKARSGKKLTESAAIATATVLLSPRDLDKSDKAKSYLGNFSAEGGNYFMEPLAKKEVGEEKRFRLHARPDVLENRSRPVPTGKGKKAKKSKVVKTVKVSKKTVKAVKKAVKPVKKAVKPVKKAVKVIEPKTETAPAAQDVNPTIETNVPSSPTAQVVKLEPTPAEATV